MILLGRGGWKRLGKKVWRVGRFAIPFMITGVAIFLAITFWPKLWPEQPYKDFQRAGMAETGCTSSGITCCPYDTTDKRTLNESADDDLDSQPRDVPNRAAWCFQGGRMFPAVLQRWFDPTHDFNWYWDAYWGFGDLQADYWPLGFG